LSLLGLARAQEAAGDQGATGTWSRIDAQWRGDPDALRDMSYSWLPEVRASAAR
jgi:hypothetical protein